jgi:PAS domain S-box-containing protein
MAEIDHESTLTTRVARRIRTAIVGGGQGCESILRMVEEDTLGRFQMEICGVADVRADAVGMAYARAIGVPLIATDYRELYAIPNLDLLIELTGSLEVRDEIERTRPRTARLIDHFGARLFWGLHQAEEAVIQQRTWAQRQVEEERERIAQIFDCIPDEIVVVDSEMVIQFANASYLRNNHLTLGDVRGCTCYEVDQEVRGECQVAVENCPFFTVMRERAPHSMVRKHFDKDGRPRFASIVAAPLLDKSGHPTGVIEMTRDITRRLTLEAELEATEVKLKQFMERAPLATWIKNRHGQYVEVNPATLALFGRGQHEVVGKTDLEILPRAAADALREYDRQVVREGREVTWEAAIDLGDREVHLSTVSYPVLDRDGRVSAICGLSKDVTAQKQIEAELVRVRDSLQSILDHAPVIIVTTDLSGRIVSFNRDAEERLGYSVAEAIGRPASDFYVDPRARETLLKLVDKHGAIHQYEAVLRRKDGTEMPVSISMAQLREADGRSTGTVAIARDISHRKALMNQIVQSERLAAVGRLGAGVAHEINNPLAVIGEIAGYLQDLLTQGADRDDAPLFDRELREGLPKIVAQVRRCRDITRRLLSFARKSEVKVEIADINAAFDEILPFLDKEARLAQVVIHRDYAAELPRVNMDEAQLEEIFINLIKNAIQALVPQGGGNVWLESEVTDGKVVLTVRDDGPGIADEIQGRLFDPFVTTKPPGQGTGLGLSICYGIIKRFDGEIRVDTERGKGAIFRVFLKVYRGSREVAIEGGGEAARAD